MESVVLRGAGEWIEGIAREYADASGGLPLLLQLKYEHSLRVAELCRDISAELGWPACERMTAQAAGLLHDAGRFPQYRRYGTFSDAKSADHGELSFNMVRDARVLQAAGDDEAAALDAIRYHNRASIPDGLAPSGERFCRLVRDADKLDIYRVARDAWKGDARLRVLPEFLMDFSGMTPATPLVVRELRARKTISFDMLRTPTDAHLVRLSWIHDLNFRPSLRRIVEAQYLRDFADILPPDLEVRTLLAEVGQYVAEQLAGGDGVGEGPG